MRAAISFHKWIHCYYNTLLSQCPSCSWNGVGHLLIFLEALFTVWGSCYSTRWLGGCHLCRWIWYCTGSYIISPQTWHHSWPSAPCQRVRSKSCAGPNAKLLLDFAMLLYIGPGYLDRSMNAPDISLCLPINIPLQPGSLQCSSKSTPTKLECHHTPIPRFPQRKLQNMHPPSQQKPVLFPWYSSTYCLISTSCLIHWGLWRNQWINKNTRVAPLFKNGRTQKACNYEPLNICC